MTTLTRDNRLPGWLPGATHALLRVITGVLFMQHGVQKLFGLLVDPSHPWNGPPPVFSQFWFAGVLEAFGGFLIVIGLLTRPVAFLLAGEMAVAYFTAHFPRSFWPVLNSGEHTVLFCFVFLYLFATGAGPFSVDAALRTRAERRTGERADRRTGGQAERGNGEATKRHQWIDRLAKRVISSAAGRPTGITEPDLVFVPVQ